MAVLMSSPLKPTNSSRENRDASVIDIDSEAINSSVEDDEDHRPSANVSHMHDKCSKSDSVQECCKCVSNVISRIKNLEETL